jgi:hypothetical protein
VDGLTWFRGEQGAVFSLAAPWPPDIERRVTAGKITVLPCPPGEGQPRHIVHEAEAGAGAPGDAPEAQPHRGASRAEWERYALSQGMNAADLADMTRNQIANAAGSLRVAG